MQAFLRVIKRALESSFYYGCLHYLVRILFGSFLNSRRLRLITKKAIKTASRAEATLSKFCTAEKGIEVAPADLTVPIAKVNSFSTEYFSS